MMIRRLLHFGGGGGGGSAIHANNGLSKDVTTGYIVLGDNPGEVLSTLLGNREIPMAGFNLNFTTGDDTLQIFAAAGVSAFNTVKNTAAIMNSGGQIDLIGSGANDMTPFLRLTDMTGGPTWRLRNTAGVIRLMVDNDSFLALDKQNGLYQLGDVSQVGNGTRLKIDDANQGAELFSANGLKITGSPVMARTGTDYDNGAGGSAGTLDNAPCAGNPSKWVPIDDNGVIRYVPAW